ncbi:hypothetical protein OPV22_016583 [Ensete ventricosum]|uniref:Exocyst subunit Exo70 family protein n=1 Tax=Ensete ventricosum TaxID=4639 RepID=A0AAV8R0A0_ENSVE|nr:hypothetical protein OPV22_016583 [Ensete ventricosum]
MRKQDSYLQLVSDAERDEPGSYDSGRDSSDDDGGWKRKLEVAWLSKALEPALQLYKWASSDLQAAMRSRVHPLALGLSVRFLRVFSEVKLAFRTGASATSQLVQELIYYLELAKGSYKDNATALPRHSML